jgi:hypothetical protein
VQDAVVLSGHPGWLDRALTTPSPASLRACVRTLAVVGAMPPAQPLSRLGQEE